MKDEIKFKLIKIREDLLGDIQSEVNRLHLFGIGVNELIDSYKDSLNEEVDFSDIRYKANQLFNLLDETKSIRAKYIRKIINIASLMEFYRIYQRKDETAFKELKNKLDEYLN